MHAFKSFLAFLFFLLICNQASAERIKVACVGNSITYGAFIEDREQNSYPAQLQMFLGDGYEVKNFGVSGTTLLHKGDFPYIKTHEYARSLEFNPDIVLIKLGTNDSKPQNRIHLGEYKQQYLQLIDAYQQLSSRPRVILLTPVRCFIPGTNTICDSVIQAAITPAIREIAVERNLEIINLYHIYGNEWDEALMPDRLHPSAAGAERIATKIFRVLSFREETKASVTDRFPLSPVREFSFYGYKGFEYSQDGVQLYIVRPHRPAKGNPWIWRARFWGHEPQTDIDLLENGFYLTYCDVGDLFGSAKAIERWDRFYKTAVKSGLHKKTVLEGMSRGGLIVYNWTVRNPKKVACIYADAPVMDIKSWPMGLRGDPGSNTVKMLSAYGFASREEASAWMGNPIDHAKKLAKAAIPMLHVVGDADTGVPVADNTAVFEERLAQYGYDLQVIHKPGVGHHPHSLNNPEPIVSFILNATGRLILPDER